MNCTIEMLDLSWGKKHLFVLSIYLLDSCAYIVSMVGVLVQLLCRGPFFPSTHVLAYTIPYRKSLKGRSSCGLVVFLDVLNLPHYGLGMSIINKRCEYKLQIMS